MSGYRIHLRPDARATLLGLDKQVRRRLQRAIDGLAAQPGGSVALAGLPGALRLRVGDHQVVYTVRGQDVLVLVIGADHQGQSAWSS
ncbi:MAG TPA: type II toxin-antitoxin system RelE/ParE family toxin [Pseudonocardiaceae bacterium]|nr:type II toxin-antitoxin system RelE/ParE family toxin [Pseudonocardiaceae bacterium]